MPGVETGLPVPKRVVILVAGPYADIMANEVNKAEFYNLVSQGANVVQFPLLTASQAMAKFMRDLDAEMARENETVQAIRHIMADDQHALLQVFYLVEADE